MISHHEAAALRHALSRHGQPCDAACLHDGGPADGEANFGERVWERLLDDDLITLHPCRLRDDVEHIRLTDKGRLELAAVAPS